MTDGADGHIGSGCDGDVDAPVGPAIVYRSTVGGSLRKFEKRGVGQQAVQVSSEAGGARLSSTSASCSVTNLFCELGQVIDSSEAHLPGFPASLKMEEAGD